MPEKYKFIIEHTPFLVGVAGSMKLNYTRIVETLIIVVLTAFGSSYLTVEKLSYEIDYLDMRMTNVEETVNHLHPRGYPKIPD